MKIGLYFGTYNPIHVGHLIIANYMANNNELDQVWLVVTPHNPLKEKSTLLADLHRLSLVKEAIEDNPKLRVSDIEFNLSKPSFTVNTLAHLQEKYPEHEFALIMGEDNLRTIHKWFNHEIILKNHLIYVYPRIQFESENQLTENISDIHNHPHVIFCKNAPVMNVSSTYIREGIKNGKDVRYLVTEPILKYIEEMHFYKN
jgi:nicotinate-nucleotide adenylyltransferase